jgi:uncharacterized membrane protein YtjA (UPF0391 family)
VYGRPGTDSGAATRRTPWCIRTSKENDMLHYAIVFLVIALIAGFLGFFGIAGTAAWIAKILFAVFIVLFLISLVTGRRPRV